MATAARGRGHPEEARDARELRDHGTEDQRERERDADARADDRHHPGPMRLAGHVARQRHHRRRHRARALQRASGDDAPDVVRHRRHHAPEREDQESGRDDRPATEPIGEDAERHLEHPLREPVDADGDAHEQRRVSRVLVRVDAEHRQEHEQPEHAQREDARERGDGAPLGRRQRGGRGVDRRSAKVHQGHFTLRF